MVRTIGQELESSKAAGAKQRMDIYFSRIQALSKSSKLESRVRFGLTVRRRQILGANCTIIRIRYYAVT